MELFSFPKSKNKQKSRRKKPSKTKKKKAESSDPEWTLEYERKKLRSKRRPKQRMQTVDQKMDGLF